jgi:MarR family transcriptional regulator, organic hydroperoxide resistance regulator
MGGFHGMQLRSSNIHSMERKSVVRLPGGRELSSLFSDLVRLETELWDLVDVRLRRDHDLALSWFEPMLVIDRTPGCRVIDIAEALSITIGGTSKLVDRIENAGWCERSPNPDDGRSSTIELTRAGRRLLAAAQRSFADELAGRIATAISANDLERFAVTVRELRSHIHNHREGA